LLLTRRPDKRESFDAEIDQALDELTAAQLLYKERDKYFTLALPENPNF
jgi:hypothetical protein